MCIRDRTRPARKARGDLMRPPLTCAVGGLGRRTASLTEPVGVALENAAGATTRHGCGSASNQSQPSVVASNGSPVVLVPPGYLCVHPLRVQTTSDAAQSHSSQTSAPLSVSIGGADVHWFC